MTAGHDWIFHALAAILGLLGLWLLYWSLFKDRSRGRRRCPKCWYDLSGTPGSLRCSECGYVAKRERKLFKTRRRWRWAFTGCLAVAFSAGDFGCAARRKGACSLIPTTALICAFRITDGNVNTRWQKQLSDELTYRRLNIDGNPWAQGSHLWDWQWRFLIRGVLARSGERNFPAVRNSPKTRIARFALTSGIVHRLQLEQEFAKQFPVAAIVSMPQAWPRGEPIPLSVRLHAPFENLQTHYDVEATIGDNAIPVPLKALEFPGDKEAYRVVPMRMYRIEMPPLVSPMEVTLVFHNSITIIDPRTSIPRDVAYNVVASEQTIRIVESVNDLLVAYRNSPLDETLRLGTALRALPKAFSLQITFNDECAREIRHIGDRFRLELLHGDEIVFDQCKVFKSARPFDSGGTIEFALPPDLIVPTSKPDDDGKWSARWFVDPIQMLTWQNWNYPPNEYCAEIIEVPIDWAQLQRGEVIKATSQARSPN